MTPAREKIADYLRNKSRPSEHDLLCFVGMIETGEAGYDDFMAVGGVVLTAAVAKRKQNLDDARDEARRERI